jgi:hypothetical protein
LFIVAAAYCCPLLLSNVDAFHFSWQIAAHFFEADAYCCCCLLLLLLIVALFFSQMLMLSIFLGKLLPILLP